MMEVLVAAISRLPARNTEDLDAISQALDFLTNFADRFHHGKEEKRLFELLTESGLPKNGGPIGVMLSEHTQGRQFIRGMADAFERLRAGEEAADEFADNALSYVALLRAHIEEENNILFMMAERMFPPTVHERLAEDFARIEAERIGSGEHERYHEMVHTLRDLYLPQAA
jgi:hemerythrin-like domain-containing protein